MTYTTHGHHIPGTIKGDELAPSVTRCGGPGMCDQCNREVSVTPKDTPADQPPSFPAEITTETELEKDLGHILSKHSAENESGTPDFILAMFLKGQLDLFNQTVKHRAAWRGEHTQLPALYDIQNGIKSVPLVAYSNGQPNEIGVAKINVTPGEVLATDPIVSVAAIFEYPNVVGKEQEELPLSEPKDEPLEERQPSGRFERYQQRGLTDNGD